MDVAISNGPRISTPYSFRTFFLFPTYKRKAPIRHSRQERGRSWILSSRIFIRSCTPNSISSANFLRLVLLIGRRKYPLLEWVLHHHGQNRFFKIIVIFSDVSAGMENWHGGFHLRWCVEELLLLLEKYSQTLKS